MDDSADVPCALVADDEFLIRMDAETILQDAGFCAFTAKDVHEALKMLEKKAGRIVLLFTDVEMGPGPNGFELARETSQRWPDISIVVASGAMKPGPGDMPNCATFLNKPFSAQMVHDHINKLLPDGQKPEPLKNRKRS